MKPGLALRASSSDYHLRMLLWTRWGQQRAGWGPEAQVAGGGGKGLERRSKVVTVPKRKGGKQENWKCHRGQNSGKQGWNRTDVSQELGDESQGNRRNKRVRVGRCRWEVSLLPSDASSTFSAQVPAWSCLVFQGQWLLMDWDMEAPATYLSGAEMVIKFFVLLNKS